MFDTLYDNGGIWPQVHVGDLPPGYVWQWNPRTYQYEMMPEKPLTNEGTTTTITSMTTTAVSYTETKVLGSNSGLINQLWYDANTETLTVQFHRGGTYQYKFVDRQLWSDLIGAESVGSLFQKTFRKDARYRSEDWPYTKLDETKVVYQVVPDKNVGFAPAKKIKFVVHYEEITQHTEEILAESMDEAIKKFNQGGDPDVKYRVTGVFIPVE